MRWGAIIGGLKNLVSFDCGLWISFGYLFNVWVLYLVQRKLCTRVRLCLWGRLSLWRMYYSSTHSF